MKLKRGLAEESYRYQYGIDELSDEKGKLECAYISLITARRDWAAFQVLLKGDEEFTV